jgi:hypothetical protein
MNTVVANLGTIHHLCLNTSSNQEQNNNIQQAVSQILVQLMIRKFRLTFATGFGLQK